MSYEFDEIDLDEQFIDEIYEKALTDERHVNHPIQVLGADLVKRPSELVHINPNVIFDYSEYIDYMFGQLIRFHDRSVHFMSFNEGFVDYFGGYWTKDIDSALRLYALGIANGTIGPFIMANNGLIVTQKDSFVMPTYNTEDPRFPDWFENVYKKQYKPRYK
jgi:hypothetical protein